MSPSMKKNLAIGGLVGVILGIFSVILPVIWRDTIRTEEDLEEMDLPVLGKLVVEKDES